MFEENNFTQQTEFQPETQNPPQQNYEFEAYVAQSYVPYGFTPETYREKKDIRRIALAIGIPCICLSLIAVVWSFIYLFLTTNVFGMTYSAAVELSKNPAVQQIIQIILSILMFLLPFPLAAKSLGYRIDQLVLLGKPKQNTGLSFFLFGIGFCSFSNIAMNYCSQFFDGIGIDYDVNYGENPRGLFGFLLSFIATAIVPALVEEFACRGIVLGLLKKYGEAFAIITSSIVFGVMHGNFDQIPFAVMVGLILGYIYVKSGSIWISVAVHCANNSISVIFNYLEKTLSSNAQNLLYIVYLMASLLAAIFAIYLLSKNHNTKIFSLNKCQTACSEKQKYTWFFTSWIIIVFLVLNVLESLTYFVI